MLHFWYSGFLTFDLISCTVHIVLVIFVYLVYTTSSEIGSPKVMYNHLLEVASKSRICRDPISHEGQACGPVSGNYKGSYLTMLSSGGLVFGIINIIGNFGTVFVDNVSCYCIVILFTMALGFWAFCFLIHVIVVLFLYCVPFYTKKFLHFYSFILYLDHYSTSMMVDVFCQRVIKSCLIFWWSLLLD